MLKGKNLAASGLKKTIAEYAAKTEKTVLQIINSVSPFEIRAKVGVYVGSAMGRPEKSRERKMKPPVHSLFPIGLLGGKVRSLKKAYNTIREAGGSQTAEFELEVRKCEDCGKKNWARQCECGGKGAGYEIQQFNLMRAVEKAIQKTGLAPDNVKAVQGLISARKTP